MLFDRRYMDSNINFKVLKTYFKLYFVVLHHVSEGSDVFCTKIQ